MTRKPDRRSAEAAEYRKLYDTGAWRNHIRPQQLAREPLCRHCAKLGLTVRATDVDHIVDHCGDIALFRDPDNLQSLCANHHSRKTRGVTRIGVGRDGWPIEA